MKKVFILLSLLVLVGCRAGVEQVEQLDEWDYWETVIPRLYVFLAPERGVKAGVFGVSWRVDDGDCGRVLLGDSSSPAQTPLYHFYDATLYLYHRENWLVDWWFIGMDFVQGYPPNTFLPCSISVERWRILDCLEAVADESERVELVAPGGWTPGLLADMIPVFDDGHDYIYGVRAAWREGCSQGEVQFAFRVNSGILCEI
jgi:hypothetical protein